MNNPTLYQQEAHELTFISTDFPDLTHAAFFKMTADEGDKWFRTLPTNYLYLAPQDVKPLAWCQIYTINGAPSVREIRTYDAKDDSFRVDFDAIALVPVNEKGEVIASPVAGPMIETTDATQLEAAEGAAH